MGEILGSEHFRIKPPPCFATPDNKGGFNTRNTDSKNYGSGGFYAGGVLPLATLHPQQAFEVVGF